MFSIEKTRLITKWGWIWNNKIIQPLEISISEMQATSQVKRLHDPPLDNVSTKTEWGKLKLDLRRSWETYSFGFQYSSSTMQSILVLYSMSFCIVFLELHLINIFQKVSSHEVTRTSNTPKSIPYMSYYKIFSNHKILPSSIDDLIICFSQYLTLFLRS